MRGLSFRSNLKALVSLASGLVTLLAACTAPPTAPNGGPSREAPPLTLDWVGLYRGSASELSAGASPKIRSVDLLITFDASPAPNCVACVTVMLGQEFKRSRLYPQTAISAEWSYEEEGVRRVLRLQKFTTGGVPGGTLLGSLSIESRGSDGTLEPVYEATLSLERVGP